MPDALPNRGENGRQHQSPEEARQDKRQLGEVVAVDIDAGYAADDGKSRGGQHPVPLPSAADGVEALLPRQEEPAVLAQVDKGEHDADGKQDGKNDADGAPGFDRLDGGVAGRAVDEGAILQEHGRVGLEDDEALGAIGKGAVGVVGVVPVLERGQVPVEAADEGVAGVVAGRKLEQLSYVDELGHDDENDVERLGTAG